VVDVKIFMIASPEIVP